MPDLLYLAFNRLEFTRKSYQAMVANTDWSLVDRLVIYDDGSSDGACEYLKEQAAKMPRSEFHRTVNLGPVGIMNDYLAQSAAQDCFVKIDNDVMLPAGWLPECLQVMEDHPQLDLLGIEAIREIGKGPRGFCKSTHIGGIGVMRVRAFAASLPAPNGRYGFTEWQWEHEEVEKGWLDPALPVGLLNLVPIEPWRSLSAKYIKAGWQRDWPAYPGKDARWDWFA